MLIGDGAWFRTSVIVVREVFRYVLSIVVIDCETIVIIIWVVWV